MSRPLLLDLFCGAGGAAVGYHRAGFDVIGVDIAPQPNYPFRFVQGSAVRVADELLVWRTMDLGIDPDDIVAIHASPPCQRHSRMSNCRPGLAAGYPALIEPTRELLDAIGLPYVIENVEGSPLIDPVMLCGTMFGYELYRHRLFETFGFTLPQPLHPVHVKSASKAGHWVPGTVMSVSGHCAPISHAREIMDMNWSTRDELTEAIPPYFSEYVGTQLMKELNR